jgi:hypothetical protein
MYGFESLLSLLRNSANLAKKEKMMGKMAHVVAISKLMWHRFRSQINPQYAEHIVALCQLYIFRSYGINSGSSRSS